MKKYIPYKDIANALAKMDILLIPYVSPITVAGTVGDVTKFTSPLKLFDYLSVGKIIMCSDFKVLREVIKDKDKIEGEVKILKGKSTGELWMTDLVEFEEEYKKFMKKYYKYYGLNEKDFSNNCRKAPKKDIGSMMSSKS